MESSIDQHEMLIAAGYSEFEAQVVRHSGIATLDLNPLAEKELIDAAGHLATKALTAMSVDGSVRATVALAIASMTRRDDYGSVNDDASVATCAIIGFIIGYKQVQRDDAQIRQAAAGEALRKLIGGAT